MCTNEGICTLPLWSLTLIRFSLASIAVPSLQVTVVKFNVGNTDTKVALVER